MIIIYISKFTCQEIQNMDLHWKISILVEMRLEIKRTPKESSKHWKTTLVLNVLTINISFRGDIRCNHFWRTINLQKTSLDNQNSCSTEWCSGIWYKIMMKIGKFAADAICAPGSIYLSKFLILGFAFYGYRYYCDLNSSYQTSFLLKNFTHFPNDIQKALRSHDSRYARKWVELWYLI